MGSNNASSGGGSNRYEPPKKKNIVQKIFEASPTVKVVKAITKNIKETKQKKDMQTALDYEGAAYKTKRGSTYVTSDRGGNDNNGNQVVQAPKVTGPTTAEVSQVTPEITSEEARASANELILKKRKGRGRSLNMLQTSAQGLSNEGLTLSNKTLLG